MKQILALITISTLLIFSGCAGGAADELGNDDNTSTPVTPTPPDNNDSNNSGGGGTPTPPITSPFHHLIIDSNHSITKANEPYTIEFYSVDENNFTVPSITFSVPVFDFTYGTLESYTVTTNSTGKATVTYQAPSSIKNLQPFSFSLHQEGGSFTQRITLNYLEENAPPTDTGLRSVVVDTNISVYQKEQSIDIDFYSLDENNLTLPNITFDVPLFPLEYGTLENYTITTNELGKGTIVYQAPKAIKDLGEFNISLRARGGALTKEITLNYLEENTPPVNAELKSIAADENISIYQSEQSVNIDFYSLDENNLTLPNVTFDVPLFPFQYGTLASYSITTDETGKGTIAYKAPTVVKGLNDFNLTLRARGGTFTQDIRLVFSDNPTHIYQVASLFASPKNITIISPNEKKTIRVLTLTKDNTRIDTNVTIASTYEDGGVIEGNLSHYSFETSNGEFFVTYTAPSTAENGSHNIQVSASRIQAESLVQDINLTFAFSEQVIRKVYALQAQLPAKVNVDGNSFLTFSLADKDNPNELVEEQNVSSFKIGLLTDNAVFENIDGSTVTRVQADRNNSQTLLLKAGKKSGIAIIEVNATIQTPYGPQEIHELFDITILSGPISTMSLVYKSTSYNSATGFFENLYTIHAVDKHSNPINTGQKIYAGAVAKFKNFSQTGAGTGTLSKATGEPTKFVTTYDLHTRDVKAGDILTIFGTYSNHDPVYMGGWTIKSVESNTTVYLEEDYSGPTASNFYYAIGNERYVKGSTFSVAVVNVDSADQTYKIDGNGTAHIRVIYEPFMAGKDIALYVNALDSNRTGVAARETLGGMELTSETGTCTHPGSGGLKVCYKNVIVRFVDIPSPHVTVQSSYLASSFKCTGQGDVSYQNNGLVDVQGVVRIVMSTEEGESITCGVGSTFRKLHSTSF